MKKYKNTGLALLLVLAFLMTNQLEGQYLMEASQQELTLEDRLKVSVLSTRDCSECYYYLPTQFRYSINNDSVPEISFVSWKNDDNTETIGAILHFLTLWGLSASQEEALQNALVGEVDSNAVLMGAALVESPFPEAKIVLTGKDDYKEIFEAALSSQSMVATTPGGKMAMSFRFKEDSIAEVMKLLTKPEKIKTELWVPLKYKVLSAPYGIPEYRELNLTLSLSELFKMIRINQ